MPELASPKLRKNLYLFQSKPQIQVLTVWIICFLTFLFTPHYKPFKNNKFRVHQLKFDAYKDIPTQNLSLNINSATFYELIELDGIGPVLANRIIEYRQKNLKIKNLTDLSSVKGLGEKKLMKIKDKISF